LWERLVLHPSRPGAHDFQLLAVAVHDRHQFAVQGDDVAALRGVGRAFALAEFAGQAADSYGKIAG